MTILLPESLGWAATPLMVFPLLLARALVSYAVGFFARRRGYGFWEFFFGSFLLDPIACAAMLLVIPRIRDGRVVRRDFGRRSFAGRR